MTSRQRSNGRLKFTHDRCVIHRFSGQKSRSDDVTGCSEDLQPNWSEQAILLAKRANLLPAVGYTTDNDNVKDRLVDYDYLTMCNCPNNRGGMI